MKSLLIAMILFVISAATACTGRLAPGPDLGYAALLASAGSGDLPDAVRLINEVRESSVIFYFLERRLDRYGNADFALVEAINEHDELHRFVLVVARNGSYELVTNIGLPPSVTGPLAPMPGDVLVYQVAASGERDRWFALASQAVPGGVGGLADLDDGDAQFLIQSVGGTLGKSVLYGASFSPLDDEPDQPIGPPDTDRYAATAAVYAFWNDALAGAPQPSEEISTTP